MQARLTNESGSILLLMLIVMPITALLIATLFALTIEEESVALNGTRVLSAVKSSRLGLTYGGRKIAALDASGTLPVGAGYTGPVPPGLHQAQTTWEAHKTSSTAWAMTTLSLDQGSITRRASGTLKYTPGTCPPEFQTCILNPGPCYTVITTQVIVSIYVNGNLCLSGNGQLIEPSGSSGTVSVYTAGTLSITGGNARIGSSAQKVKKVTAYGGIPVGVAKVFSLSTTTGPALPLSTPGWHLEGVSGS